MKSTYSITEAQSKFPALVKESAETPITITRHDQTVGYLLSPEKMEAILETLEYLGNPAAMQAVNDFEQGKVRFKTLEDLDAAD